MKQDDIDIWLGIDVGKSQHWATAVDNSGKNIFSRQLPNDEAITPYL